MKEIALLFGPDRNLVGTLTLPVSVPQRPLAFLLTGAGVIHRIGPHRINVKLARHLAQLGFASLRFDLAGQGDSRSAASTVGYAEQAVVDMRAAMDHVGRTIDVQRFAIAGICSGADNAFATAQTDKRVEALFLVDGQHYSTSKTRIVRWQRRIKGPILKAIAPWLTKLSKGWLKRRDASEREAERALALATAETRPFSEQQIYAQAMQALVERQVQICLLFSGSLLTSYNYASQFREVFTGESFVDKVEVQYCPEIDHTMTPLGAQQDLQNRVAAWALRLP
jgi:dienelactone hydrolase